MVPMAKLHRYRETKPVFYRFAHFANSDLGIYGNRCNWTRLPFFQLLYAYKFLRNAKLKEKPSHRNLYRTINLKQRAVSL